MPTYKFIRYTVGIAEIVLMESIEFEAESLEKAETELVAEDTDWDNDDIFLEKWVSEKKVTLSTYEDKYLIKEQVVK